MSHVDVDLLTKSLQSLSVDSERITRLLETFTSQHAEQSQFVSNSSSSQSYLQLFDALLEYRLLSTDKWRGAPRDEVLRVLQTVRLLTRDDVLRQKFVAKGGVKIVATIFDSFAKEHFGRTAGALQLEILTECASVVKRLVAEGSCFAELADCRVHLIVLQLLNSSDPEVLTLVLWTLIGFAVHKDYYSLVSSTDSLENLVRIVQHFDLPFKRLAADALAVLSRRQGITDELLAINGLGRLVGLLQSGDSHLTRSLLRMLYHTAAVPQAAQEMYQMGVVPMLLPLLHTYAETRGAPSSSIVLRGAYGGGPITSLQQLSSGRVNEIQLACTALASLVEASDDIAYQARQCNGIYLLGRLLLLEHPAAIQCSGRGQSSGDVGTAGVGAHALRALRYLFSMERNRKQFNRLFPPDLFAHFIDIGNYIRDLAPYIALLYRFQELSEKQRSSFAAALEDINTDRDSCNRVVHGYEVLELLGKGAFGAVYKARRNKSEALVALKELPLTEVALFGCSDAERSAGAGRMSREVEILSSLQHPNIVQYYGSFVESQHLYIVMELVEGPSLMNHITSISERGRSMPEADIWQVVIAVVLALNYIHGQKRIIHRDLTPGNIVLGQGAAGLRHTKVADFGLAKCLATGSITHSVVGTMPYTCPEIIQQADYSEKADVWSLGCCIYHMMMLRAPFDGSNPLSVASKIVEGTYDPLADPPSAPPYTERLKQLVTTLLTTDPSRRPDIMMVAAGLAPQLMGQLDTLLINEQVLLKQLNAERRHRRASWDMSSRKIDAYRKLAHMQRDYGSIAGSDTASQPPSPSPSTRRNSISWVDAPPSPTSSISGIYPGAPGPPGPHAPPGAALYSEGVVPLSALGPGALLGVLAASRGGDSGSTYAPSRETSSMMGGTKALLTDGQGSLGSTPRTVSILQSRLKPVADPASQILQQLQKVMWVEQLPPGQHRDPRRRIIECFRRMLFSADSTAGSIKMHTAKLAAADPEVIRDLQGPVDFGAMRPSGSTPVRDGCLTYQQLQQMLEAMLDDSGFYKAHSSQTG